MRVLKVILRELLKTSAKSLTNEDLAGLEQSTIERNSTRMISDAVSECDFTTKGLGEVPGERHEALELGKSNFGFWILDFGLYGFIVKLNSAAKPIIDLLRIPFVHSENLCMDTVLTYVMLSVR